MTRILAIAALVVSVGSLALAAWGGPQPAQAGPEVEVPAPYPSGEDAEDRLQALEEQLDFLARRVTALERRPQPGGPTPVPGAPPSAAETAELSAEVARLKTEVQSMIAGEALHSEGGKQYLREQLQALQQEQAAQRRAERAARAEARQAELAERWRQFARDAQLSWPQEQELTQRLEGEQARRAALMAEVQQGSRELREVRPELRALRRDTDQAMAKVLSPAQLEQYQALRGEDRRPRQDGRERRTRQ